MQKLVIDTNVLVSSLTSRSYPYFIIRSILPDKNIEFCVSAVVTEEYQEVLGRKKFLKYPDFVLKAENLLASIDAFAIVVTPNITLNILTDPNDNKFLELAVTCDADYLITGNIRHFPDIFENTRIVTPKEYWEKYR